MSHNTLSLEQNPEINGNQELTPEKLSGALSWLRTNYCAKIERELGIKLKFPDGSKAGNLDFSGKSLDEILTALQSQIDTYEPPVIREEEPSPAETEKDGQEMPEWLAPHQKLIWHGTSENPVWKVQPKQHGDTVDLSYIRRSDELKPGKSKFEQAYKLDTVKNEFNIDEWKIMQIVFDYYYNLEADLQSDKKATRLKAKEKMLSVLKEENSFRKGSGETPKLILEAVTKAAEKVAKGTRGKRKELNLEELTQSTAEILSQLLVLNRTRGDGKEHMAKPKSNIKEIPSFKDSLGKLAEAFEYQQTEEKGITLLMGEAGTGKNEMVEYFAAKTGRPYYWFPCGRGMESVDLVSHYEFDSKEGTKKFLTNLAKGVQTPGAIVFIDEVNALKEEVQTMLHGLGDANRSLNYDGINIPVAKDVLIIIAGNPATYGSAGDIGTALLDRAGGFAVSMDYPALQKGELLQRKNGWPDYVLEQKETEDNSLRDYAADEILVLYSILNEFSGINDEEFTLLWDVYVNEKTQGNKRIELDKNEKIKKIIESNEKHIIKTLTDLRDILKIADMWRKKYKKREAGFDMIGVSMRNTIAVVNIYKKERDVRKAYMKFISIFKLNPIEGLDFTHKQVEQLIDDTLGSLKIN